MLFLSYAELHSEPLRNRSIINLENKCFGIPHYLCSHISSKCIVIKTNIRAKSTSSSRMVMRYMKGILQFTLKALLVPKKSSILTRMAMQLSRGQIQKVMK